MKKVLLGIIVLVLVALVATNYTLITRYAYVYLKTDDMFLAADTDDFDRGLLVGEAVPELYALHEGQVLNTIAPLMGSNGAVVVINRSVEWCPFCMRQSIELQKQKAAFDEAGIALIMMTYDTPE